MTLNNEFKHLLVLQINNKNNDLLTLRECLTDFRDRGMNAESMLRNLAELRGCCDEETEDILLELMDFVTGFCNPNLSIF